MSSTAYVQLPIETDPEDALADAYASMESSVPGWQPSPSQLDVMIFQSVSAMAAAARDVASAVPAAIFRWFGAYLINLPPIDDAPAYANTTWTMIDNLGHTIPAGTQVAIPDAGGNLIPFETVEDIIVLAGVLVTDPGQVQIVAVTNGSAGNGLGGVGTAIQLLDPLTFVSGVVTTAATSGGTDAEDDPTYLNRLSAELELLAPRPILPADFAIFARDIDTAWRSVAIDGYNPFHNYLTLNEASIETDATGWINLANSAVAQTAAQAADGSKSLQLTAASAADMSAVLAASKTVAVGEMYSATACFRSAVTARSTKVGIQWRDAGDALLSTTFGAVVADGTAGFTQLTVTGVAPANAVKARVVVYVVAPANAEAHYVDKISLRHGSTTDWVPGGTAETGNPRMVTIASVDVNGAAVSGTVKTDQIADLQSRREVNFIVNAIDATVTLIDVTYTAKALDGYDHIALLASINTALTGYLDPTTWGALPSDARAWRLITTIRYLEIAQVINNVLGVDYIVSLTLGIHGGVLAAADLNLPGVAPLPNDGTLTGTIT